MQIWIIIFMSAAVHVQHPEARAGQPLTLLTPWVVGSETFGDKLACESALTRLALDPEYEWYRDGFLLQRTPAGLIARRVLGLSTEQAECHLIMNSAVKKSSDH